MPRASKGPKQRHDPLHVDLEQDAALKKFGRVSQPGKRKTKRRDEDEDDNVSPLRRDDTVKLTFRVISMRKRPRGCWRLLRNNDESLRVMPRTNG